MNPYFLGFILVQFLWGGYLPAQAAWQSPVYNSGFEDGLQGWSVSVQSGDVARVLPDAASLESRGLRVRSTDRDREFVVASSPVPVTAGLVYAVEFWSRSGGEAPVDDVFVSIVYADKYGHAIELDSIHGDAKLRSARVFAGRSFVRTAISSKAPEAAKNLLIKIQVSRKPNGGYVDLDDFVVSVRSQSRGGGAASDGTRIASDEQIARQQMLEADMAENMLGGSRRRVVVLKLDDFGPDIHGKVPEPWRKLATFSKSRGIKMSFGVVSEWVNADALIFLHWVRAKNSEGFIEFWNHGWDHKSRIDERSGKLIKEFQGEGYSRQREHLSKANRMAKELFGFPYVSFGAPFNATDEDTVKALAEDGAIKVWIFGNTKKSAGKIVLSGGVVGLEYPEVGLSYSEFIEHLSHNKKEELLVLQGHPRAWSDAQWVDFFRITELLIKMGWEFRLPRDFVL